MNLYPKEIADRLYQDGKMPEWFYRQHYKTFQENWIDSFNKGKERRKQELIQKQIDAAAKEAIEKALEDILKTIAE